MSGLSEDLVAALVAARCPRPCKGPPTLSQRRLMPDGTVEITGEVPPPPCDPCPQRSNPKAPIRHLEVRWGFEAGAEIVDTESTTVAGAGIATITVLYDDPRSAHPGR
jgi:hypothetical protein